MIPIKLILENFISHSKSEIDFTKFDVALVVGSYDNNASISNGSGKTTIFDAIRFALYNKTRFNAKEKVVKFGKIKAKVEFIFSKNEDVYKVVRVFSKKSGIGDVDLYKKNNSSWVLENCDTPTGTTQKIMNIVGMSHDTFVSSIFFKQNDIAGFAGASATKRKEILKEVLQIGVWDEYHALSKEKEKELNKKMAFIEQRIFDIGNVEKEKQISEDMLAKLQDESFEIEEKIKRLEQENKTLDNTISEIELSLVKNGALSRQDQELKLQEITKRALEIKKQKETLREKVEHNNVAIEKASCDRNELENRLKSYAKDILLVEHKHREKAALIFGQEIEVKYSQQELTSLISSRENIQNELNICELELSHLKMLEPGKECPICLSPLDNLEEVSSRRQEKEDVLKEKIVVKRAEKENLTKKINEIEKIIKRANESAVEIERTELIISKKSSILEECGEKNQELRVLNNALNVELKTLKEEKDLITSIIDNSSDSSRETINSLLVEKKEKEKELISLRKELLEISSNQGATKNKLENIERKISEKEALFGQKEQVSFSAGIYSKLTRAFGKDGIQAIIMENITEDLKNFTNSVLETICDQNVIVDFITQTKKTTGDWKEDFEITISINGSVLEFDDLSGGEQVRVAMAIRLAIGQLLMQRSGGDVRFLLLDEVDQALDSQGVESLSEAIKALAKDFKILVITHNEAIKEKFNHVINVIKQPSGSTIEQ